MFLHFYPVNKFFSTIFLDSIYMCCCCCCCCVTSIVSNSVRPHRRQPTRLLHPWDSPGKNTGVGWHFLLQCMKVKSESEVAQSCPTLSDAMDCSLPGSSIHGIFQARVLEWDAIVFSDICVRTWYLSFSFWLTSLCIIGSRFIHLIRNDSNAFLYMAE